MQKAGYNALDFNQSVFINETTFVAIYVDDLFFIDFNTFKIFILKAQLSNKFKITNLKIASHYLSIEIIKNKPNKRLKLQQRPYLKQVIRNLGL